MLQTQPGPLRYGRHQGDGAGVRGARAAAGGEQDVPRHEVSCLAQSGLHHVDGLQDGEKAWHRLEKVRLKRPAVAYEVEWERRPQIQGGRGRREHHLLRVRPRQGRGLQQVG